MENKKHSPLKNIFPKLILSIIYVIAFCLDKETTIFLMALAILFNQIDESN